MQGGDDSTIEGRGAPRGLPDAEASKFAISRSMPASLRSIGPYRLLSTIGEGGFGVVYLAEQAEPIRRRVAVKVIKPGMDTARVIARFEAERQALAMMDHPCIARVLDAGTTDASSGERPYFVMELVKGDPFTDFCDRARSSVRDRIELFCQVCDAVQHAHAKGVIHRDLKPSNILVEYQDGRASPKVIDFGVAKALHDRLSVNTVFTERGQIVGTPEYMSPEQAEMSGVDIDTRSDVYSLGVLLFELMTGSLPIERAVMRSAGMFEIQRMIRSVEAVRPSSRLASQSGRAAESPSVDQAAEARRTSPHELVRVLRGDLDWIVLKCLDKDRSRRYATAEALRDDLRRHLAGLPVLARPPSTMYRASKFVRRNRGMVAVACLIVVSIMTVAGVAVASAIRQGELRALAEARGLELESALERATRAEREAIQRQGELVLAVERANEAEAASLEQAASARAERDKAERVLEFMRERVFGQLHPDAGGIQTMTVAQLLDRAAADLENQFADRPEVQADLLTTLGTANAMLERYDQAMPMLERALSLIEAEIGSESLEAAQVLRSMALAEYWHDRNSVRMARATELLRRAVAIDRRLLPEGHARTARDMGELAMFEGMVRGRPAAGFDPLWLTMISMVRGRGESLEQTQAVIDTSLDTVERLWREGRREEAMDFAHATLEPFRRSPVTRGQIVWVLAGFLLLPEIADRPDLIEVAARYAMREAERTLPATHPHALALGQNFAHQIIRQGRFEESLDLSRRTFELALSAYGHANEFTRNSAFLVGQALIGTDDLEHADDLLLDVWEALEPEKTRPFDRRQTALMLAELYWLMDQKHPGDGHDQPLAHWRSQASAIP